VEAFPSSGNLRGSGVLSGKVIWKAVIIQSREKLRLES